MTPEEKAKEAKRLYMKAYREKNRERINERRRKYYEENKEYVRKYHRIYNKKKRAEIKERQIRYWAEKLDEMRGIKNGS